MELGITGIVYNGYGKFLPQFFDFIRKSTRLPKQITIVLGRGHELKNREELEIEGVKVLFIEDGGNPNVGRLTNLAIEHTNTEWIMPMDVDDLVLPHAVENFEKYEKRFDYLCIAWRQWFKGELQYRWSPLPIDLAVMPQEVRKLRRINNNSPFRRKFWEMKKYEENDYPNLPFLEHLVLSGARFVKIPKACITYRMWQGSLSGSEEWVRNKRNTALANLKMYRTFEEYYL